MSSVKEICGDATRCLHQYLILIKDNLPDGLVINELGSSLGVWDCCFRISGFKNGFDAISISHPKDTNRLEAISKGTASWVEIILCKDNDFVFIDEIGYDDVLQFKDFSLIFNEIKRLSYL
jgi:hypothetical protein